MAGRFDRVLDAVLGDRSVRFLARLLAIMAVVLLVVNTARADVRPATPSERWAIDDAAQLLRSKGVTVPDFQVLVEQDIDAMHEFSPGVPADATAGRDMTITLNPDVAYDAREAWRASLRPARFRASAYDNSGAYNVISESLHEVAHLAQFSYGSFDGCDTAEGVAEAVAFDWARTIIRRRFGRVAVLPFVHYEAELAVVLGANGETMIRPTSYAGRAARLEMLRGVALCPRVPAPGIQLIIGGRQ